MVKNSSELMEVSSGDPPASRITQPKNQLGKPPAKSYLEDLPENLNESFYPSVDCHLTNADGLFNKLTGDASERWGKYCICQPRVISAL